MSSRRSSQASSVGLSPITPPDSHSRSGDGFPFHRRSSVSSTRRLSNASSVGGRLDTSGSWSSGQSVAEAGQNAISTLLQPPIVRTGLLPYTAAPSSAAFKPPTAKDIPPVTLTNIRHVDQAEFRPYLQQVSKLYDQLNRAKEQEADLTGSGGLQRKGGKADIVGDDGRLRPGKRSGAHGRKSSVSSITSPIEAPSPIRRASSGLTRRGNQGPPPLSTIPTVYFDEDFHLENPRTFDIVSERSEVLQPPPGSRQENGGANGSANGSAAQPRKALATNAILQEKLSWYMDTVEMHLISSISTASTTFFGALGSLKELHHEAAESVVGITAIRQELATLNREVATSGLALVEKGRRRENLEQLQDTVAQLKEILHRLGACESLVDEGDNDHALDSIEKLESFIAGEGEAFTSPLNPHRKIRLRDLRGAAALQDIGDDLATLRGRIGKGCEARFVNCLLTDLRRHVEQVSEKDVLQRWNGAFTRQRGGHKREASAFPSYFASTDDLRAELTDSLAALYRARCIGNAASTYREAALREIKNLVKRPLPSSSDDDNVSVMSSSTLGGGRNRSQQEKSSALARNLRALDPEDAESMLTRIYVSVTETMRRVTTQVKLLLDVASCIQTDSDSASDGVRSPPPKGTFSPGGNRRPNQAVLEAQEEIHKSLDLSSLLGQAVDVSQDNIVKLLRVRSEQSTHLELARFLRYFTLNLHFANECESISGRSGVTLKNVVNGHIRDFVQVYGDAEKQRLAQRMEQDQWSAVDFTESDTKLLALVLESSTSDPSEWLTGLQLWQPYSEGAADDTASDNDASAQPNGNSKPKTVTATIDEERFSLPDSAVACLIGITHFLRLVTGIPPVTTDVATSLVAYLQLFNSRCTQLILGAGAMRTAGLRNISTKHLALASQALSFVATLIPHVRECIRRHAGSGPHVAGLLGEFDRSRRGLQEHQHSIHDKLVEIMSGRAMTHSKTIRALDWESIVNGEDVPQAYMQTLVKETTTLHKILVKYWPEMMVRTIMVPVFASYKEQFSPVFEDARPRTELGRARMLRDIDFFEAKLGKIDGYNDTGEALRSFIKAKTIAAPAPAPASKAAEPPAASSETEQAPEAKSTAADAEEQDEAAKPTLVEPDAEDDAKANAEPVTAADDGNKAEADAKTGDKA